MNFFVYKALQDPNNLQSQKIPSGFNLDQVDNFIFTKIEDDTKWALVVFFKTLVQNEWKRVKLDELGQTQAKRLSINGTVQNVPLIKQDARAMPLHKEIYDEKDQIRFLEAINAPEDMVEYLKQLHEEVNSKPE